MCVYHNQITGAFFKLGIFKLFLIVAVKVGHDGQAVG